MTFNFPEPDRAPVLEICVTIQKYGVLVTGADRHSQTSNVKNLARSKGWGIVQSRGDAYSIQDSSTSHYSETLQALKISIESAYGIVGVEQ